MTKREEQAATKQQKLLKMKAKETCDKVRAKAMILLEIRAASCALCCAVLCELSLRQRWKVRQMCEPG
jgi:hypothetical protein